MYRSQVCDTLAFMHIVDLCLSLANAWAERCEGTRIVAEAETEIVCAQSRECCHVRSSNRPPRRLAELSELQRHNRAPMVPSHID
jgi:hypothetical protein